MGRVSRGSRPANPRPECFSYFNTRASIFVQDAPLHSPPLFRLQWDVSAEAAGQPFHDWNAFHISIHTLIFFVQKLHFTLLHNSGSCGMCQQRQQASQPTTGTLFIFQYTLLSFLCTSSTSLFSTIQAPVGCASRGNRPASTRLDAGLDVFRGISSGLSRPGRQWHSSKRRKPCADAAAWSGWR